MTTIAPPIAASPDDNEFVTEILARRRRRLPKLTLALAVAVAVGAGFAGGAEAYKHYVAPSSTTGTATAARAAFAARFGGAGGAGGGAGAGGAGAFSFGGASAPTTGTVTLIKGNDIYVTTSTGDTVIVHASAASVTRSVSGTVKSILPGDSVTVVGSSSQGAVTARSIAIGASNG